MDNECKILEIKELLPEIPIVRVKQIKSIKPLWRVLVNQAHKEDIRHPKMFIVQYKFPQIILLSTQQVKV